MATMKSYIVRVQWESEDITVKAKTKDEAKERAREECNMEPDVDSVYVVDTVERNKEEEQ